MVAEKIKGRVTVSENGPYIVTGDIPLAKQTIASLRGSRIAKEGFSGGDVQ
jgi:hypothetical protein